MGVYLNNSIVPQRFSFSPTFTELALRKSLVNAYKNVLGDDSEQARNRTPFAKCNNVLSLFLFPSPLRGEGLGGGVPLKINSCHSRITVLSNNSEQVKNWSLMVESMNANITPC